MLRQMVVLSGKGGTGKTTVTAALAHLAAQERRLVLADADVDAANLELLLAPERLESHDFRGGKLASIDTARCTGCGVCYDVCRFEAIEELGSAVGGYRIDAVACEGCAACAFQCPVDAIDMVEQVAGEWYRSDTRLAPLFHAHLDAGQENSGKLVTMVKHQAHLWALDHEADLLLVDGPPGIGCPVISASAGADVALLVVEPTVSGVHDLTRIMATTDHFGLPSLLVLNKADLNEKRSEEIASFAREKGVQVVGAVPFDPLVTEAMVQGYPVTEYGDGPASEALGAIWERFREPLWRQ